VQPRLRLPLLALETSGPAGQILPAARGLTGRRSFCKQGLLQNALLCFDRAQHERKKL
jgi:hypothetical protein